MSRPSKRSEALHGSALAPAALLLLGACAPREARFETASELPDEPRRPPAVTVDPAPALPDVAASAATDQGLVVLSSPPDPRAAREAVKNFFGAVVRESAEDIDALVAPEAWVDTGVQRQPVRGFWRVRFSQLDYGALSDEVFYRESELETYATGDLARVSISPPTFVDPQADDVVVRARVRASWTGRTRLFGDELYFLLRPEGTRFVIAEIIEDFRLP